MNIEFIAIMIFIVALTAVVMGVGNEMFQRWLQHKERQLELIANKTAEQAAQYAAKAQKMEARVRVLERIATDRGVDLAIEIKDLRDTHETESCALRESVQ